jgi:ABC-type nitrate/sulfonate/bicarbonate transport system substrate-binding protein
LLVRSDAPLQSGKDFNDQIVGVGQLGDVSQIAMMAWVDAHGGDARTVKFTEIPTTAAPAAVLQGRVAAAESTQPMIAAALVGGDLRLLTVLDAFGPGSLMTAWATTRDTSSKRPDAIRAFARAYREAVAYTNVHRAETVEMMAAFTGAPASVIATMPRATAAPVVTAGQIQPVIDAAVKYGLLERTFPASELIDAAVTGIGERA